MSVYTLKHTQQIPVSLDKAWDFFSRPENLQAITPPYMNFRITSDYRPERMYPGHIITYKVSPLFGISLSWMTEITHVRENEYFVDEQRFGPFRFWHHQHHFKEIDGGVEMMDLLHYKLPGWFAGKMVNKLSVRKQLNDIFEYRNNKVIELFGEMED